jgi:hypothetical protein
MSTFSIRVYKYFTFNIVSSCIKTESPLVRRPCSQYRPLDRLPCDKDNSYRPNASWSYFWRHQTVRSSGTIQNKKFREKLIASFPLTGHGPHRKRSVQLCFSCFLRTDCRGNVFTEPLPSNDRAERNRGTLSLIKKNKRKLMRSLCCLHVCVSALTSASQNSRARRDGHY